jgi:drug/metabolite transporter (DMT)-like permease
VALPQDGPVPGDGKLSVLSDSAWIASAWIPLTLTAATLQALRTAAQKWLGGSLTTDAATYVRYLFAWPVAVIYAAVMALAFAVVLPLPTAESLAWAALGAAGQIGGTRFLLKALESRNFAVGVTYSKTDVIQAAIFETAVLGASIAWGAAAGIVIATAGVMMISLKPGQRSLRALVTGLGEPAALYGLLSGASFAISGVAVRGAVTTLDAGGGVHGAALVALITVLTLQVVVMGAWLAWRQPGSFAAIASVWRPAMFAGVAGGFGSICWFLALGLQNVAYVRTLGLVEILASVALSRFMFKERARPGEYVGIAILLTGIMLVLNAG